MAGEIAAQIGRRMKERRIELRLNQRELAERIPEPAVDNQRVSDWERGVNRPSERYMPLIAEALDRPVAWFYESDEPGGPLDGTTVDRLQRIEDKLDRLIAMLATEEGLALIESAAQELEALGRSGARVRHGSVSAPDEPNGSAAAG